METKDLTFEDLQEEFKKMEESRNYWMDRASKMESRYNSLRDMIKSLVVLTD